MDINEVWVNYKKTNDAAARTQLIEHYAPLVKRIAGMIYPSFSGNVEYNDLISYGVFGLIDAVDKYDLSKDIKFETYASLRIRGDIVDNIRRLDWIPHSARIKAKELQNAINTLEMKLLRIPTNAEIAQHMNLTVKEVEDRLADTAAYNVDSLDEMLVNKGDDLRSKEISPEESYEMQEIKELLAKAIDDLPERERLIIALYYYEELTIKEIGQVLNVSESRVSQIHSKIILRLKNKLAAYARD